MNKFIGSVFVVFLIMISLTIPVLASEPMPMSKMADLNKAAESGIPYIVMVTSDTCTTCEDMKIYFPKFLQIYKDKVSFMMVDSVRSRDVAVKYGVRIVPTTLFFDEYGDLVNSYVGAITEQQMLKFMSDLYSIEEVGTN